MLRVARKPDLPVLIIALAGLVVAGYLAWIKWLGTGALFCTTGSGCDIVQASRYNAQAERCERAGVRVFPTWEIGGSRREGVLSLEALAEASGYPKN